MYYFAYGSNMFTYRLEKRVGKVDIIGLAKLTSHRFACNKLSKDGSLKADALHTGKEEDFVLGVVFDINPAARPILDKEEGLGRGYERKDIVVIRAETGKEMEMFTYVTQEPVATDTNAPYSWYMELILAGAEEHQLPPDYMQQLRDIATKKDEMAGRESVNQFLIKESRLPKKNISPAIEAITELSVPRDFTITVNDHPLNNQPLYYKGDENFGFETTSPIQKGLDTHRELELEGKTLVLENVGQKWFVPGKDFLIHSTTIDGDNLVKHHTGTLNSFHTKKGIEAGQKWYRFIMPVEPELSNQRDYQASGYVENYRLHLGGLIETNIDNKTYHFYSYVKNKSYYAVIDCLNAVSLQDFQRACHCILLTSTFISGTSIAAHSYFVTYDAADMEYPVGIIYQRFGEREENQMPVFTTNPYTGIKSGELEEMERDQRGGISADQSKKLYEGMIYFPQKVFSEICDLTYKNDKLLRALLLWAVNQSASLEMKLGVQYILLETLAGSIVTGGNADMKPIKEREVAGELTRQMKNLLDAFCEANHLKPEDIETVYKKVEHINAPANMDKLEKAFAQVNYALSDEEKKVLKKRNVFLHGSLPSLGDAHADFKELFHLSLRLHFMTALLTLKHAGFEGKIINYAKIHEGITGKFLDEERLVKI